MMQQLPWELEEKILSLIPTKILAPLRLVCKRWNSVYNEKRFFNSDLGPARPQFILLSDSKFCSVEVNLEGPSIEVHKLPTDIPGYKLYMPVTVEYCDGLLIYVTCYGTGICNPWLRQAQWIQSKVRHHDYNGMGYDSRRSDKHYKIFKSSKFINTTLKVNIMELGSHAEKNYEFATDKWNLFDSYYSVSLNGTLYWVAYNRESDERFIQSFDFSTEIFKPYCILPSKNVDSDNTRSLAVFRIDRFSFLEYNYRKRDIEIWVTKEKIKNGDGEAVEWMELMSVSVPESSSFGRSRYPPSYFIDENKSLSLVMCYLSKEGKACIYIAKGDRLHEIEIKDLADDDYPLHRAYCPSLVQVPTFSLSGTKQVGSRFALPRGVEAGINGVAGKEWDDGFFDHVKKINLGWSNVGVGYIKFDYRNGDAVVLGAVHGDAETHTDTRDANFAIAEDDYIEAVEGTYTESHITSIAFRMHKRKNTRHYGLFNGRSFTLGGGVGDSKIIGFYGKNDHVHLTALGVHLSPVFT